mmetsp:Transcript_37619/g.42414  ORF Transcript_37619/g.42414 Transcript_37619/m.42414 type:complete len:584 (-) Transcript_37619:322-2073(-)
MPNKSKRKSSEIAESDSSDSPELTKKEKKRLLARKRAAEYGKKDLAKIEDHKAKREGRVAHQHEAGPKRKKTKLESNKPIKADRKQRKKTGSVNAQKFAARDQARLEKAKNANISNTAPVQSISAPAAVHAQQVFPWAPPVATYSATSVPPKNTANAVLGVVDPLLLLQHEEEQKQQINRLSGLLSPPAGPSTTTTIPVMKKVPQASNNNNHYMPPPTLQAQISQQVLVNARDFDDDNKSDEDVLLNDDNQEESSAVDNNVEIINPPMHDNGNELELQKHKPNYRFLISMIVLLIIICICYTAPAFDEGEKISSIVVNKHQCFLKNLADCPNKFQDLSDKEDQCILINKYSLMVTTITNHLVNHASKSCNKVAETIEYAMLKREHSEILVEESPELIDAMKCEGYRISGEGDSLYLGLPENFNLNLPFYCKLGDTAHSILETIGSLLLNIISIIVINYWGFLKNYPKLSGSGLFGFGVFLVTRKRRVKREQRERKIDQVRGETDNVLKGNPAVGHIVLHIRDEIAMQLYPHSRKERQSLINEIWPKIVNIVQYDTRVRKTKRMVDGKPRDVWQWVAVETPVQG